MDNTQPSRSLHVINTPFCGDLRSKKFYMQDEIPTTADDYYDYSGHIFCYHTQMPIGPDGFRAEPEACTPDRQCYRSGLSEPTESPKIEKENPIYL